MNSNFKMITARPFYTKFAWAYDQLTDKPVDKICDFISMILKENSFVNGDSILDAGCGTGSYSIKLAETGFNLTGVDISTDQIEQANLKLEDCSLPAIFKVGNFLEDKIDNKFDVVICRGVLNDICDEQLRANIFYRFAEYLKKPGCLIFDVRDWEKSRESKLANPITRKQIIQNDIKLNFKSETTLDEVNRSLIIKETHVINHGGQEEKFEYDFVMRCWNIIDLKNKLKQAGFDSVQYFGDYDKTVPVGSTEKIICAASICEIV